MISSNILMNIFMQVFGVCKSYNYKTHLSTYTPTRSRPNHRLVAARLQRWDAMEKWVGRLIKCSSPKDECAWFAFPLHETRECNSFNHLHTKPRVRISNPVGLKKWIAAPLAGYDIWSNPFWSFPRPIILNSRGGFPICSEPKRAAASLLFPSVSILSSYLLCSLSSWFDLPMWFRLAYRLVKDKSNDFKKHFADWIHVMLWF